MIGDMDFIEKYMLETILHQQEIQKFLSEKKLMQTQEVHSNTVQELKDDSVVIENTCFGKENSNSEPAFNKLVNESSLVTETKDVHAIKYKMSKAFMSLFGQDDDTFTSTLFLNIDQLQKQLDKDEFQEVGSMAAFWVLNNQF
ncbi:hypothetical protein Tco_0764582 [Tanacetum coccineum]